MPTASIPTQKIKIMLAFGTRPEAIKMAPVYWALKQTTYFEPEICVTAQHRELLDQVLKLFDLTPEFDLNVMQPGQSLYDITSRVMVGMGQILEKAKPQALLVHGDTTTTLAASLAAFYQKIPVGHVEAGLRTGDPYSPFPEEMNRKLVGFLASLHFAPTESARNNLLQEGVHPKNIYLTGNTAIDALMHIAKQNHGSPQIENLLRSKKTIVMTAHRRENFGAPIREILQTVAQFLKDRPDFSLIYPIHPNPNVKGPAEEILGSIPNAHLIEPVSYEDMVCLMKNCQFILTDSGGIQEEAPTLGKPVLVLRESTERPEAVAAGCAQLVGSSKRTILHALKTLSNEQSSEYLKMSRAANPFGDGVAGIRIVDALAKFFQKTPVVQEDPFTDLHHGILASREKIRSASQ